MIRIAQNVLSVINDFHCKPFRFSVIFLILYLIYLFSIMFFAKEEIKCRAHFFSPPIHSQANLLNLV
jgi:hypothetical protein